MNELTLTQYEGHGNEAGIMVTVDGQFLKGALLVLLQEETIRGKNKHNGLNIYFVLNQSV